MPHTDELGFSVKDELVAHLAEVGEFVYTYELRTDLNDNFGTYLRTAEIRYILNDLANKKTCVNGYTVVRKKEGRNCMWSVVESTQGIWDGPQAPDLSKTTKLQSTATDVDQAVDMFTGLLADRERYRSALAKIRDVINEALGG